METAQDDHRWARTSMAALGVGLLDEDERARLLTHLTACADCRGRWTAYLANEQAQPAEDAGTPERATAIRHIPASMLARWDRARSTLRGLERQAVSHHLESCPDCRDALRLFGHAPTLGADPQPQLAPSPVEQHVADQRPSPARGRPLARWPWLWGGMMGAALTAGIAALVFVPRLHRAGPLLPSTPAESAVVPWVAPTRVRGEGAVSSMDIGPDAHALVLLVAVPASFDRNVAAVVEVRSPAQAPLLRANIPPAQLAAESVTLLLQTQPPLAPGSYQVVLWQGDASAASGRTTVAYFELRSAPATERAP